MMPFDQTDWNANERMLFDTLVRQADEAFETQDRERCVELIRDIYALLDAAAGRGIARG